MEDAEIITSIDNCSECRGTYGVHLVDCSKFHCTNCGQNGISPNHYGGCPEPYNAEAHMAQSTEPKYYLRSRL
jgi:hypothetical protein